MLNIKSLDLRSRLASDAGENSIMQTITIAVSAILIAAGLITAPGLINNARDNNARGDLSNLAYAEEYNLANFGTYDTIDAIAANVAKGAASDTGEGGGIKFTKSDGVIVYFEPVAARAAVGGANPVAARDAGYNIVAVSPSGKVFLRDSYSSKTTVIGTAVLNGAKTAVTTFTPNADGTAAGFTKVKVEGLTAAAWR